MPAGTATRSGANLQPDEGARSLYIVDKQQGAGRRPASIAHVVQQPRGPQRRFAVLQVGHDAAGDSHAVPQGGGPIISIETFILNCAIALFGKDLDGSRIITPTFSHSDYKDAFAIKRQATSHIALRRKLSLRSRQDFNSDQ
ncbi:hypothetical protein ABID44_003545 [Aquamicrobium ahrensii]|uniref:Uncharacterized protein n=1 Tax=Aquamicrobium ahrensii TaxID=469551 RepID=A0ABV2KRH7_9HYPH